MLTRRAIRLLCAVLTSVYLGLGLLASVLLRSVYLQHTSQHEFTIPVNGRTTTASSSTPICPSALELFDNITSLETMIEKAKDFHQRGGNLISIEKYLNSHVQKTLDNLNIQFVPNGKPAAKAVPFLKEYYKTTKVKRGGYGQPLPGKYTGDNVKKVLMEDRWIDVIEPATSERFLVSVGDVGPECATKMQVGKGYQEKVFCVNQKERAIANVNVNDADTECNIFSIGSNDQWDFEIEVMEKLPHCRTHTFDCTLNKRGPKNKPKSDNVLFYPYCVGTEKSELPYLNYQKLWENTHTDRPPKILKMDIEGFEYDVLLSLLAAPKEIWPEQIMMEVHTQTRMVDVPWMLRARQAGEISLLFGTLFNVGGYIPVNVKYFKGCYSCMEILLVRALCT